MHIPQRIIHTAKLADGSYELFLEIEPDKQVMLGYILEGLDGFCYHTVSGIPQDLLIDKSTGKIRKLLKIIVVPAYYHDLLTLLATLNSG